MAASIESMIKFVNKRMSEVSKYFGVNSTEYHSMKNILYQNLGGGADPLLRYDKGKISISRSKMSLQAFEGNEYLGDILEDVYRDIQEMGTVRTMANEYFEYANFTAKELSDEAFKQYVRERSYEDYRAKYLDDDTYQEVNRLLLEESGKYGTDEYDEEFNNALEEVHDILTEKGRQRDYAYAIAERKLNDAKAEHEKWLLQRALEKSGEESDLGGNE
jgi:predicted house-cleaning noncanonical NTP pyrophosphatase (MazG superfamily)